MKAVAKTVLDAVGLLDSARTFLNVHKKNIRRAANMTIRLKNRLLRGSQADFFEELMDRRARKGGIFGKPPEAVTGWPDQPRRQYAVKFLIRQGWLTPEIDVLDYGCGNAATGVHFIRALEPKRYTGADLSSGVLQRAREWVAKLDLEDKKPEFIHLAGGSLAPLAGRKFDVVFSQDVVTHMAPNLITDLVRFVPTILKPGGVFFVTYTHCDADIVDVGDLMDWYHSARFFKNAAAGTCLVCDEVNAWSGIEYKNQPLNRMVRFSLK